MNRKLLSNVAHIRKGELYSYLEPWLGTGLLISTGSKWHHRRKVLTAAFHFNILKKYKQSLMEHGERVVKALKELKTTEQIDISPFFTGHTLSAICETAMGTPLDVLDPVLVNEYREAVMSMADFAFYRVIRPWLANNFLFLNFTPMGWQLKKQLKLLHNFSGKIIKERKEYHDRTDGKDLTDISIFDKNDEASYSKSGKKRMAMLDLLLAAHREGLIDEKGIQEEVDTFIFEGHDTSGSALCYTICLLAEHIEAQEKARQEINEVWKSTDDIMDMSMLNKLHYLERCIKESLRLFPAVPFIIRQLDEDLHLKNYRIPDGTAVVLPMFLLHKDPKYWPEPDKFIPDRFLPENILKRHPFSYLPFSGGFRNCIGQRFAMMELKIIVSYVLKHFYMETDVKHTDIEMMADFIHRPIIKLNVRFIPINQ